MRPLRRPGPEVRFGVLSAVAYERDLGGRPHRDRVLALTGTKLYMATCPVLRTDSAAPASLAVAVVAGLATSGQEAGGRGAASSSPRIAHIAAAHAPTPSALMAGGSCAAAAAAAAGPAWRRREVRSAAAAMARLEWRSMSAREWAKSMRKLMCSGRGSTPCDRKSVQRRRSSAISKADKNQSFIKRWKY
jgi:hypothetical protein